MKCVSAIATEKATPKSQILTQRKVICVVLDSDDLDKLQDKGTITINMEESFPEINERVSVVFCYHHDTEEAIKIFKGAFDLVYLDERKT